MLEECQQALWNILYYLHPRMAMVILGTFFSSAEIREATWLSPPMELDYRILLQHEEQQHADKIIIMDKIEQIICHDKLTVFINGHYLVDATQGGLGVYFPLQMFIDDALRILRDLFFSWEDHRINSDIGNPQHTLRTGSPQTCIPCIE